MATTEIIKRPLRQVENGDFFYHNNKRYVKLDDTINGRTVLAVASSGRTVRILSKHTVKQFK